MKLKDKLETQEFYEYMQQYRHCKVGNQSDVVDSFEAVKDFIKKPYKQLF